MKRENANKNNAELPENLSWRECSVPGGIISFECPKCKEKYSLQTAFFASPFPLKTEGLTPTGEEILWGKEIGGIFLAFVVAFAIGGFLTVLVGKPHIWIAIVSAVIWMILKPIFVPKFMKKLPVWISKCKSCGNRIFIASDGTTASISERHGS